jgi:hypothetical protein
MPNRNRWYAPPEMRPHFVDPRQGLKAEYEVEARRLRQEAGAAASRRERVGLLWRVTRLRLRYLGARFTANW